MDRSVPVGSPWSAAQPTAPLPWPAPAARAEPAASQAAVTGPAGLAAARDRLDALTSLVLELSSQRRVDDVLDVALRQCLRLTGSEFGFVGLVRMPEEELEELRLGELEIVAIQGFHPASSFYTDHRVIPLRPNIFNRVVLDNRPVRTVDATTDPGRIGQPRGHPVVRAFLGVPLRLDGAPIGMIGLANRPGPYQDDHEQLALTYAGLIAVLVNKAQLYEQLQQTNAWLERLVAERTRELAQARDALADKAARLQAVLADTVDAEESERRRIAQDVHDGMNQLIIGAMLELTSGQHRIETGQLDGAVTALTSARQILAEVETEIRGVVHDLHPPVLDGLGLTAALRAVAERVERFSGLRVAVHVRGRARRLPERTETNLYRIVQEALHNVTVHAKATQVDVRLHFRREELIVSVSDDGQGFDVQQVGPTTGDGARRHLGLGSMRRRVESLGGTWRVQSTIGQGTTLFARIPINGARGRARARPQL